MPDSRNSMSARFYRNFWLSLAPIYDFKIPLIHRKSTQTTGNPTAMSFKRSFSSRLSAEEKDAKTRWKQLFRDVNWTDSLLHLSKAMMHCLDERLASERATLGGGTSAGGNCLLTLLLLHLTPLYNNKISKKTTARCAKLSMALPHYNGAIWSFDWYNDVLLY